MAFEPFWAFVLDENETSSIRDLKGKRVGLGPPGSGSRATTALLLADNDLEDAVEKVTLEESTPDAVAQALTSKQVDVVFLVGEIGSPLIAHLLGHPDVVPLSLPRTAAFARRHRSIAELVLPEGAFSLARDIPAQDLQLISPTTNLVTRDDLPPPVIGLLLQGAKEIHHPPSLFAPEGTFPNARHTSLPRRCKRRD